MKKRGRNSLIHLGFMRTALYLWGNAGVIEGII